MSGPLGIWLRRQYYSRRLQSCGKGLVISEGVFIQGPGRIIVGDDVWIDKRVILIAGKPSATSTHIRRLASVSKEEEGCIHIGSCSHLGMDTLVQGHGGVWLDDCFTSSRGVNIYSYSNDPYHCLNGTLPAPETAYISAPVHVGRNTWVGLNSILVGAQLGDNTFVKPQSLVTGEFPSNVVLGGQPTTVLKNRFS